jgi:hypothetical protein
MEQHAARGRDIKALEDLGVQQRKHRHLLERVNVLVEAADLVERHRGVHAERVRVRERRVAQLAQVARPAGQLERAAPGQRGRGRRRRGRVAV